MHLKEFLLYDAFFSHVIARGKEFQVFITDTDKLSSCLRQFLFWNIKHKRVTCNVLIDTRSKGKFSM